MQCVRFVANDCRRALGEQTQVEEFTAVHEVPRDIVKRRLTGSLALDLRIKPGQDADRECCIDRYFLWNGDVRLLIAIIKYCEDGLNVGHDTRYGDVRPLLAEIDGDDSGSFVRRPRSPDPRIVWIPD